MRVRSGHIQGNFALRVCEPLCGECAVQRQILSPGGYQGEGISVPRMRAEMGSPWSVSLLRHAEWRLAVRGRSGLGAAVQLQEVLPGLDAAGSQRLDGAVIVGVADDQGRAEEHTSELQSRFDLVCSLLLEKEKTEV